MHVSGADDAHLKARLTRWTCERGDDSVVVVKSTRVGKGVEERGPYGKVFWGKDKGEGLVWEEGGLDEVEFFELVDEVGLPGRHVSHLLVALLLARVLSLQVMLDELFSVHPGVGGESIRVTEDCSRGLHSVLQAFNRTLRES